MTAEVAVPLTTVADATRERGLAYDLVLSHRIGSEQLRGIGNAAAIPRARLDLGLAILDETVVNVALPPIQRDLHLDEGQLAWVVNAYLLLFGGFLLLAGKLADLIGRRLFLAGVVLFCAASIAAGLAGDRTVLITARAAQGLGGAMLSPAALSILTTTFTDPRSRRLALAAWAAMLGLGATAGVLPGGVIVEYLSWHWIFWVDGPVGAAVLVASVLAIPAGRGAASGFGSLDLAGAVLVTAAGLLPALLVNSAGLGVALVPLAVVAVHGLADEQQGIGSGLLSASQQLGGAVGLAVLVSIAATIFQNRVVHAVSGPAAFMTAFHTALVIAAGFLVAAAAMALRLPAVHERVDMAALAG